MTKATMKTNLDTSDLQTLPLLKFREELENTGAVVIQKESLPWSIQVLHKIDTITSPMLLPYKRSEYGDTGERNPVSYFRILHPTIQDTSLPECMALINTPSVKNFFLSITGLQDYEIDRCQAHLYSKGDFINLHTDSDSCPAYAYSLMLLLSDHYEGGEFVMHDDGNIISLKPEKYSLVIVKSSYPHEVKEITEGIRRTLVFFLKI